MVNYKFYKFLSTLYSRLWNLFCKLLHNRNSTVVLIPKGKGDYRGIGLVEVMWKVVAVILNRRLTSSITLHDVLHGFRAGRGTGTATLKAKLLQQLAAMREEVLYVIFLDLTKAYDALDRSRCLDILEGYGVGPGARRLLINYWRRLTMAARAGGYYGTTFGGERGVTQGDPMSPTLFNVVVDAVVRRHSPFSTERRRVAINKVVAVNQEI